MKSLIAATGWPFALLLAAGLYFLFIQPMSKANIEKGKQIERKRLQYIYDSIKIEQLNDVVQRFKQIDIENEAKISALQTSIVQSRVAYQNRIRALEKLTGREIDSVFVRYAADSSEAVALFYALDQCEEEKGYVSWQLEACNITLMEARTTIDKVQSQATDQTVVMIDLRTALADTETKLVKVKRQRNYAMVGVVVLGTILILQ
jgi:uncharacterized protein YbcI